MADQPLKTDIQQALPEALLLRKVHDATIEMALETEFSALIPRMIRLLGDLTAYGRVVVLIMDEDDISLKLGGISSPIPEATESNLRDRFVNTYNMHTDDVLGAWLANQPILWSDTTTMPASRVTELLEIIGFSTFYGVPMVAMNRLIGAIVIELEEGAAVSDADQELLDMFARSAAVILQNARLHNRTVEKLASHMNEMSILGQIDQELNETIDLPVVFNLTLDWALRFTNANMANIALYDEDTDNLRTMLNYGYDKADDELEILRENHHRTVTYRVARTGRVEVMPDVTQDPDLAWIETGIQSQMAVPVTREDRVIGVITLESRKVNGFTDAHISFVQTLANRASVAIDNARLYDETVREREKLSHILRSIGDVVVVIDREGRVLLMSKSAISVLELKADVDYTGSAFLDVIQFQPVKDIYLQAIRQQEAADQEIQLPNDRVYATTVTPQSGIGFLIVMQDITLFKEMDRLKSELIATVSHDLKQPLGVMRGYLDLLQMTNEFDEKSLNFITMIDRSIMNMRQLIDDLLDLARIESGLTLEFHPVGLRGVLTECIDANEPTARSKNMTIIRHLPDRVPLVSGEAFRLQQIFNNLISNAVKYTPPDGEVIVSIEDRGATVRISVQDNGIGITPEDQARVFERFYRVRRPETDSIDGTGLGLAIVKSLVEAHHGKIRLESELGKGTTFYVTLPTIDMG